MGTLRRHPAAGRDVLARRIEPLTLTPTPEGGYRLDGRLNLAAVVESHGGEEVLENESSGGVRSGFSSTATMPFFREVAAAAQPRGTLDHCVSAA